jgi:predicted nucleotidyltransferase
MTEGVLLPQAKPILARFRAALGEMYGERLERVVLYGSRARGDATEESDYDIAIFIRNLSDRMAESDRIALAATDILSETGTVIHAIPFPAGSYRERTLLMHEIRREGLDL